MAPWDHAISAVRESCKDVDKDHLYPAALERLEYLQDCVLNDHEGWVKSVASCGAPDDLGSVEMHVVDFADSSEVTQWIQYGWSAVFWSKREPNGRPKGRRSVGDHGMRGVVGKLVAESESDSEGSTLPDNERDDFEAMLAKQQAFFQEKRREEALRQKDPLSVGRWVTLHSMQTVSMNGCIGDIVERENPVGRVGVRVQGHGSNGKLIKTANLQPFADDEVVKIVRIGARGEQAESRGVRTWYWPQRVLSQLPSESSRVSELLGVPLRISKIEPIKCMQDRADFDNQWATYLMKDPLTGFAPDRWQSFVGPVVVWRPSWEPFSADDSGLLHDFISRLLDRYPDVDVERDITPEAFQSSKCRMLEVEKLNPHIEQSEDVNI